MVRLKKETGIDPAAARLTCVGGDAAGEIDDVARDRTGTPGIRHIVALRGDPAAGDGADATAPHPGRLRQRR